MTRRRYLRKCRPFLVAIHKKAEADGKPMEKKLGEAFRYMRDYWEGKPEPFAGNVAGFESYKEMWDALKDVRKLYGVD